ncbi:MAG: TetR/AcrR family transcriptional regulator [Deltaproteobacteria bacterium]|nr:TetR/AcrR family transcriptional regulator [Deltaproteobacteria bacterium]
MSPKSKREVALQRLYTHCAEHGFKGVDNVSFITKAMGISRSLFYFYFADTDDLLRALLSFHKAEIDVLYSVAMEENIDFLTHLNNLIEHKDNYFFTLQAVRHAHEHPLYREMSEYTLSTIDARNFREFVKHYGLERFSESSIRFMYESFRNFWFINSDYRGWTRERVNDLLAQVNSTIELLKATDPPGGEGAVEAKGTEATR